jgi:glyoxylase-like metal-dependent hydrolase (beta-lactamase superfamily II)
MAQESEIKLSFYASGYCEVHTRIVNPINGIGKTRFYAVWALMQIPDIGYVLFDTGYSEAFYTATQSFPNRFYRWATPVTINKRNTAKAILAEKGVDLKDIKYVIVSHFHADHIAGLIDFPNAKFICSESAYQQVRNLSGIKAVSKGIIHSLLPFDFNKRVLLIEEIADNKNVNKYGITEFSFLGIRNLKLVILPGHAKGMLGFYLTSPEQNVLYATDASWDYNCYRDNILPSKVVKLFFDSWSEYINTIAKLKNIEKSEGGPTIFFTHCTKTLAFISNEI